MITLTVNGEKHSLALDPDTPLLWVLRDALGLKGTKYGCGVGLCGVCTVLLDSEPNHACMVPLARVGERAVTTIEGLPQDHGVKQAWIAAQVPQCGYCQPGQIMTATALLARHPQPSREQIDAALSGVLCRCGTYPRIRLAIEQAARGAASAPATARAPLLLPFEQTVDAVALNPWVRILPDGQVVLVIDRSEMGQGATTALAMLLAEELEIDLEQVRVSFAPADPVYDNRLWGGQFTGGSSGVRGEWQWLREQGAAARAQLVAAAARRFGVAARDCHAAHGEVLHPASNRRVRYGEVARDAAAQRAPRRLRLKPPAQFRLVGHPLPRIEIPDMVAGRALYGIDVALPGMLSASVLRCPVFGGRAARFDAAAARALPGVREVFAIDAGIAVVADNLWAALRARDALQVDWDEGDNAQLDNTALRAALDAGLDQPGKVAHDRGHAARVLRAAARTVEARYHTPYLAHAPLEPLNCVAHVRAEGCDVWVGTQSQVDTRKTAARIAGLPLRKVRVHTLYLGGGFGRRLETDFVADAVEISRRLGVPVQVVWTRADDLQHDTYRPAHAAQLRAALDAAGCPQALLLRVAGPELALDGIEVPYAFPHLREEHVAVASPVPTGPWRSVGASNNAFAIECFIDELAHAAGRDPLALRLALLADAPRHRAVLQDAAAAAGWGTPLPAGSGRGVAVYCSFGSWVAQVAEVSVSDGGQIRVPRVVCSIDCGQVVNPDTVRAQLEGSIAMGLSAALKEEVRIARGRVTQASYADYPILTLAEMPAVEVRILPSAEPPGGVGEPGLPVIAPAVANALFAATGRRLRALPLRL